VPTVLPTSSPDAAGSVAPFGILVTRPEPGASRTARQLCASGLFPVVAPFLLTTQLKVRLPVDPPQAIVAASGNAAEVLPKQLHALPLLAVGDATAQRARDAGFADVRSAGGDASDLAQLATAQLNPAAGSVMLATGQGQGAALARDLRQRGFRVHRRAVYAACPVARFPQAALDALESRRLQAALFFSAETARAFVRLIPLTSQVALTGVDALAIGSAAADVLRPLPWRAVRVALRPTQDGVLALI